jgi:hypothetical protein
MAHLILQGDNTEWNGFSLLGESSLAITLDETGNEIGMFHFNTLDFLVLKGTTSVSIASMGVTGGINDLHQLAEKDNVLTTVTISGSEDFALGVPTADSNSGDGVVTDIAATATSPTKNPFFADAHRCVGDDRRGAHHCRWHKHERRE